MGRPDLIGAARRRARRGLGRARALRDADRVLDDLGERSFWPLSEEDPRLDALMAVLTAVPEVDYARIVSRRPAFYMPGRERGAVLALSSGYLVYLSLELVSAERSFVRYVVAHELAHVALGHVGGASQERDDALDAEADDLVLAWARQGGWR